MDGRPYCRGQVLFIVVRIENRLETVVDGLNEFVRVGGNDGETFQDLRVRRAQPRAVAD
jgi:hypothetical protein